MSTYVDMLGIILYVYIFNFVKVCDYSPVRLYLALVASLARAAGHQIVMNSSSIQHLLNRCLTMLSDDRSKASCIKASSSLSDTDVFYF